MKKIMKYTLVLLAGLSLSLSCSKIDEKNDVMNPHDENVATSVEGKQITICAKFPDAVTRVAYALDETGSKPKLTLSWEDTDVLVVSNASGSVEIGNPTIDETGKTATFTGVLPEGGAPYTVSVKHAGSNMGDTQTQASDGDLTHLEYAAMAENVTEADFEDLVLSQTTGVLGLIAKIPTDVSANVKAVIFQTENNLFNSSSNTLTVKLTNAGAGTDNILYVYANIAAGAIPAGTEMFIRFKVGDGANDYYTRYQKFDSAVSLANGALNGLKLNCSHIDRYAGKDDDGTQAAPYLIADKYQLAAVNGLATAGSTTYFKMIDNVDMTDVTHNPINTANGYTQVVSFDGNDKTISNLAVNLFYVFKGSINDLTLKNCNVGSKRGIFAEYCQGTGHTITNVNILNGSVSSGENVGSLIGRINSGTAGMTTVTITDCEVSGTNVTGSKTVGGVIGFAEAMVDVSGCKYTGGTVTCGGQYVGGFVGSTGNVNSTFTNCQVELATINANHTEDARGGGFVGQLQDNVTISGCTVGSSSKNVVINTKQPTNSKVINVGGFVGVCYGTITKNGDVRSNAYVKITSNNTLGTPLKLGGFVGFHSGNIEYCDAIVDMTSLKGQHIGGFAGYVIKGNAVRAGRIDNCTVSGQVTGNNYTGGFAGYVDSGSPELSNNTAASGSVTAQSGCGGFVGQTMSGIFSNCSTAFICSFSGSNNGGFVGQIHGGTLTGCSASGNVTATGGSTYGGFVGLITNEGTTLDECSASGNVTNSSGSYNGGFGGIIEKGTVDITRCFATGNIISSKTYASAFIGNIASNEITVTIQNCYATGDIINSDQIRGGFIAQIGTVKSATVSNCYASGAVVGSFRLGGLIGNIGSANIKVDHCAAWNSEVTAGSVGSANWSSGAVVGTAFPSCTLTDNYRKPDIKLKAFWGNVSGYTFLLETNYQHANVDGSSASTYLVVKDKTTGVESVSTTATFSGGNYPIFPYHGKVEAGKTLSQLASTTLGWSSDVWDFSGELPQLKWAME